MMTPARQRFNPRVPSGVGAGFRQEVLEGEWEIQRTIRMRGYLTADNWGDPVASAKAVSDTLDYLFIEKHKPRWPGR